MPSTRPAASATESDGPAVANKRPRTKAIIPWSTPLRCIYLRSIGQDLPLPIIELHFDKQGLESRIAVRIAQQGIDRDCCCHKSHHAASNIIWVYLDLSVG
jgi:hypothetical protein